MNYIENDSGDETDHILPDAIDWSGMFEKAYPKPEIIDGKNMSVKSETEEDRDRLWKAVQDYSRS